MWLAVHVSTEGLASSVNHVRIGYKHPTTPNVDQQQKGSL